MYFTILNITNTVYYTAWYTWYIYWWCNQQEWVVIILVQKCLRLITGLWAESADVAARAHVKILEHLTVHHCINMWQQNLLECSRWYSNIRKIVTYFLCHFEKCQENSGFVQFSNFSYKAVALPKRVHLVFEHIDYKLYS